MIHLPNRWAIAFWTAFAVGCVAGAVLLGPQIIPPLDAKQEQFRDKLERGIGLLRLDLAAAAVLALVSLFCWRRGSILDTNPKRKRGFLKESSLALRVGVNESASNAPIARPARWAGWLGALLVLAVFVALAGPRLGTTLWWDELITLTTVKRGPVVILTFSGNANNHILNSLLLWASLRGLPENEIVLHLTPFLFSLTAVQIVYWTLLCLGGLRPALLAGLAAATHPSLLNHAVESRGYAAAILLTFAAMVVGARLLTHGSWRRTLVYVAVCVAAFGFISTTILVPFSHGAVACLLFAASFIRPELAAYRANAVNLIFACLWVLILALLFFGLPLPQTMAYASELASIDHLPLGWALGRQVLAYVSGLREIVPAALLAGLACLGWWAALRPGTSRSLRSLAVGSLAPVAAALLYVLVPHSHSSGRFFCFLILPFCCGVGLALDWLLRLRPFGVVAAVAVMAGWLALLAVEHQRLFVINRPDLKSLGEELRNKRVVLIGAQADMNVYYFPSATWFQLHRSELTLAQAVEGADFVLEGRASKDNRLEEPDAGLVALGFHVDRTLPNAVGDGAEYLLYRRGDAPR